MKLRECKMTFTSNILIFESGNHIRNKRVGSIYNSSMEQNDEKISNSMLSLAGILSKTEELYTIKEEGETVMCEAMREILEEAEQKGIQKERENLIMNCLKKGHTCEAISDFNDISLDEVKEVERKFLAMKDN